MAARRLILKATLACCCLAGSLLTGCDEQTAAGVESVKLNGSWFHLEIAADQPTRVRGLGGRDYIAPDGGMLFVFPRAEQLSFVMRDCLVPIDIIYLDATGRITAMHQMTTEPLPEPKHEAETDAAYNQRRIAYEMSLTRYPSRYAAQFVIELAGGKLDELELSEGDKVDLDLIRLKSLAQ